jgi:hypothetical protein
MAESNAQKIVKLCEKHWEAHKDNCSGFVKAVAGELGVALAGQANEIVDQMQKAPWLALKSGVEATAHANMGKLVLGGLKATRLGHVVIVVPGPISNGKYPTAYWGSYGGVGKKSTTVNWSWDKTDRDKVTYCAIAL